MPIASAEDVREASGGIRRRGDRRGAVPRARDRRVRARARESRRSSRGGRPRRPDFRRPRSGRCPICCRTRSSWTSCRPSVTAAAARRRPSVSSTATRSILGRDGRRRRSRAVRSAVRDCHEAGVSCRARRRVTIGRTTLSAERGEMKRTPRRARSSAGWEVGVVRDREPADRRAEADRRRHGERRAHAPRDPGRPRSPGAPSTPRRGGSRRRASSATVTAVRAQVRR